MFEWNGEIACVIEFETLKHPGKALGIQAFGEDDKQQATEKKVR